MCFQYLDLSISPVEKITVGDTTRKQDEINKRILMGQSRYGGIAIIESELVPMVNV